MHKLNTHNGSILLVASFALLGVAATLSGGSTGAFSLASIGLVMIWIFVLQRTGTRHDAIIFDHLKSIEGALTEILNAKGKEKDEVLYSFGMHKLNNNKTNYGRDWWVRVRAMAWAFVLFILSLSWFLLSVKVRIWLL